MHHTKRTCPPPTHAGAWADFPPPPCLHPSLSASIPIYLISANDPCLAAQVLGLASRPAFLPYPNGEASTREGSQAHAGGCDGSGSCGGGGGCGGGGAHAHKGSCGGHGHHHAHAHA